MRQTSLKLVFTLSVGMLCAAFASGQDVIPLLVDGDLVPGVGPIRRVDEKVINAAGDWIIKARTSPPSSTTDAVIVRNGALFLQQGNPLPEPSGAFLAAIESVSINAAGRGGYIFRLGGLGSNFDRGVFVDTDLIFQTGDSVDLPGMPPGRLYQNFQHQRLNASDQMLVLSSIGGSLSTTDRLLAIYDVSGGGLGSTIPVAATGDPAPGTGETFVSIGIQNIAFNDAGNAFYFARVSGPGAQSEVFYLDKTLLARTGFPSPVQGRSWIALGGNFALNARGEHVYSGRLDGEPATDVLLVKNGVKFQQEGDTLPDIAPYPFTFSGGPIWIADNGDVLWQGFWPDVQTLIGHGLFVNDTLIVQAGDTTVGGLAIQWIDDSQDGYFLSEDGRYVLFDAILIDGSDGAFLLDRAVGTIYCTSLTNSTGSITSLAAVGSASVSAGELSLGAAPVPAGTFGLFYYGPGQTSSAFGNGIRCVSPGAGNVFRLPLEMATAGGGLYHALDFANPPGAAGQILPSATWNFQGWFRDSAAGGAGFNMSSALEITFEL